MDRLFGRFAGIHAVAGKIHDHDSVLLHNSHQHEHADKRIERRLLSEHVQSQQPADERGGKRREHRQRVHIALVQDGQDHVHYEYGQRHQDGQIANRVAERQGLALQARAHGRRHDLHLCLADEVGGVADGHSRLEIVKDCDTRELVQVVYGLGAQRLLPGDQRADRYQIFPVVGLDIQQRKVFGLGARGVLHFQNDLILVLWFLDQVKVILRIGVPKKRQDSRLRNAVGASLVAPDIDFQIRRVVEEIGGDGRKPRILPQPRHEFLRHVIHLLRAHSGEGVGILSLVLVGRARADFEDGKRSQEREHARDGAKSAHQPPCHGLNGRAHLRRFQECEQETLIGREELASRHYFVSLVLQGVHLLRGRAFASDHHAPYKTAVADRQKSLGNDKKKQDRAGHARSPSQRGDPTMLQEPPKRFAVYSQHPLLDAARRLLDPILLDAVTPDLQQPCAHQRSERQRYQSGSDDRDDDGDGEFAEDAAHQARHEDQRKENRRERDGHRKDGKADFLRALQSGRKRIFTLFHQAYSVLQKHDGIVNQEPYGECQCH